MEPKVDGKNKKQWTCILSSGQQEERSGVSYLVIKQKILRTASAYRKILTQNSTHAVGVN